MNKNNFIKSLTEICEKRLLEEKWLIAPSLRVGHQWVDSVVRGGGPAVNVRVKTLNGMAVDIIASRMAGEGLGLVPSGQAEIIVDSIWEGVRDAERGYLGAQRRTFALSRTIAATVAALRMAGVGLSDMKTAKFEVEGKGKELAAVLREYDRTLKKEKLIDYAEVLKLAAEKLRGDGGALPRDAIVLLPGDAELAEMEKRLIESFPKEILLRLATDPPSLKPENSSLRLFSAIGDVNEVREVLRRCMAEGISFDDVEILHTDASAYIPLIYETMMLEHDAVGGKGGIEKHDPAVTFAEGIPTGYSRPGRALKAWLEWNGEGFPQTTLVRMIQDGLLEIPGFDEGKTSFARLADDLRAAPIFHGRERYLTTIDERMRALKNRLEYQNKNAEADEKSEAINSSLLNLKRLRELTRGLLETTPEADDSFAEVLRKSITFIEKFTRNNSELDNYASEKLVGEIRNLLDWTETRGEAPSLDVREALSALARDTRVLGSAPRPGRLHVADIHSGGHSGRPNTFIIGLDDTRFPGAPPQNPLLLDSERQKLSPALSTSAERLERRNENFARLLARLRGDVTLGFSRRGLKDDRELFPSPALLEIHRAISGESAADLNNFYAALPPPASFAPSEPKQCRDEREWWLLRLCGGEVKNAEQVVFGRFPNLERGRAAEEYRRGDVFTAYDGRVERAGNDNDPAAPDGPVMSSSRLETLGRCPTAYFFKYILKLEPPDEVSVDPSVWLDPMAAGSLLHEVFERFMRKIIVGARPPEPKDWNLLENTLDGCVAAYRNEFPPPNENAFKRQYREMLEAARTFLAEEELHCKTNRPAFLEASIGLPADAPTELDTPEPVSIKLPNGKNIRARGIIDRVDAAADDENAYSIWDYKTGGASRYSQFDPFRQGRIIQHYLYLLLVGARLKEVSPRASVRLFGFFFPGVRGRGERMWWTPEQLDGGGRVLLRLCETIAAGAFVHTDSPDDCRWCEYSPICGEPVAAAASGERKLSNPDNKILKPFRELREYGS